jgi:hypothetical protein
MVAGYLPSQGFGAEQLAGHRPLAEDRHAAGRSRGRTGTDNRRLSSD